MSITDYSAVLPTAAGAAVRDLIAAVTKAVIQRRESGMRRKTEYLNQVVGAYDDLSEALRRYNRDCIKIVGYDTDHEDPRKVYLGCQTAFLDFQYEFDKPPLRSDENLRGMLERLRMLNVEMSNEIMYPNGGPYTVKVKGGFMKDLTDLKDEINDHIWEMKRRILLGEYDLMKEGSEPHPDEGSREGTRSDGVVSDRGPLPGLR